MLQIQSIGDGNCLYNSEAIWLIHAYQQQKLKPLLKKNLKHFANLMLILSQQTPELGLPTTLDAFNTVAALEKAFDSFITKSTVNENIDWIKIQKLLAKALRTFVVEAIKNDATVKLNVTKDISTYIDGICESSLQIKSEKNGICDVRVQISNALESYLPDSNQAPKKLAALKTFVENEFTQFIDGAIDNLEEKREVITGLVKDELKKVVQNTIKASSKRALNTIHTEIQAALLAYLEEKIGQDIDDEEINLSAHFAGMPTLQNAIKERLEALNQNDDEKKQAIKQWFFENEAQGLAIYLNSEDGMAADGVDAGELEQKVLSSTLGHIIKVKCLDFLDDHNTRIVNGFKSEVQAKKYAKNALVFEMEKLPGHWNVLLPVNEHNQKLADIYQLQKKQYVESIVDTNKPFIAEPQKHNPRKKAAPLERDWFNYTLLMITITSIVAIISNGVLWPLIILPMMQRQFAHIMANTALMAFSKFASISIFSSLSGYLLTEKIHLQDEANLTVEKQNKSIIQAKAKLPPKAILNLYQSAKSISQDGTAKEEIAVPKAPSTVRKSAKV